MLCVVWNWTDNILLAPMFLEAGYAEAAVEWIKKLPLVGLEKKFDLGVISIVYNLSRHKGGLHTFRQNHAFEILMEYKPFVNLENVDEPPVSLENVNEPPVSLEDVDEPPVNLENVDKPSEMMQLLGMSLIVLATSDDDQKQNQEVIRKVTENLYGMCKEASEYIDFRCDGYLLSDILDQLECSFANMSIVQHVLGNQSNVKKERIKFFAELLTSTYGLSIIEEPKPYEKIIWETLLNILLCISNYIEYRAELRAYGEFRVLIEGLTKRPKQDIAKRILSNLKLDENPITPPHQQKTKQQPLIYISYNRADEEFCRLFVEELSRSNNIEIWVDYENVSSSEDLWDSVAPIIQRATIIIVLVSNAYWDSIVNFQELTYAMTSLKKQSQSKNVSFIFIETGQDAAGKREWISDLTKDKIISYNQNIDQMVNAVLEHDAFLKKYTLVTNSAKIAVQSHICTII
ncbi:unnamed protein product [Adineta steineri]|uniref:TIR domain-containing protein n=1 Tax=Adineta steineri TaxID=433720 RepID=A0A819LJ66_9BILA|nr:unnamed protein product [Adineta steineri]CAF3966035.1 unnamed protein product [Adineta steineri]